MMNCNIYVYMYIFVLWSAAEFEYFVHVILYKLC